MQQYYDILNIDQNASKDDIKKAYKKMALKYHPDRNKDPTATEQFKKISEAYQYLTKEEKQPTPIKMPYHNPFMNHPEMFSPFHGGFFNIPVYTNQNGGNISFTQTTTQIINGKKIQKIVKTINGKTHVNIITTNL